MKNAQLRSKKPKKPLFKGAAYKRAQNGYKFWYEEPLPPKVQTLKNPNKFNDDSRAQKNLLEQSIIQWGCQTVLQRREKYSRLHFFHLQNQVYTKIEYC